jgi:hypothetical protein
MTLVFPNESRSYDATRDAVRFWGYDTALEISFFVTVGALRRQTPKSLALEDDILDAFDDNRSGIRTAAQKAYAGPRQGSYELTEF